MKVLVFHAFCYEPYCVPFLLRYGVDEVWLPLEEDGRGGLPRGTKKLLMPRRVVFLFRNKCCHSGARDDTSGFH